MRDLLPTLLRSPAVKPCLVILVIARGTHMSIRYHPRGTPDIEQVLHPGYPNGHSGSHLRARVLSLHPTPYCAQVRNTVELARKSGKVRVLVTTRDENILKRLKVSIQVIHGNYLVT